MNKKSISKIKTIFDLYFYNFSKLENENLWQTIQEYKQKIESINLKERFQRMYQYSDAEKRTILEDIDNLDVRLKRLKFELIKRTHKNDK